MSDLSINLRQPELLYVDDSADDQLLAVEAVAATGCDSRLTIVSSAVEMWTLLLTRLENGEPLPSVLVVDLRMPQVDGHLLMDKLAQDPELSFLPVVVLTTSNDPVDLRRANGNGAFRFSEKPHRFDELVDVWADIIRIAEG